MLWVVAGGAAAIWCALLALLAARSEPRGVRPGAPTLDLVGDEPPAVVGLVARDWELPHDAVTATVLDLAARRLVAIEWIAPRTFLRVPEHGPAAEGLTPYEAQVLDHLRAQSAETSDGMVPTEALTTGPEGQARSWWRRFERAVIADARARGLSRPRWGAGARVVLGTWAVVVGLAVGGAMSTVDTSSNTANGSSSNDPVGTAVAFAVVTAAVLMVIAGKVHGERDTTDGRAVAARWLGVREMLTDDPTFPVQPPAAVAVWGRLMAYGAALGLTGAAANALPLGAERERTAWSPVGDRWRPVRIRYPDVLPPGYGRSPILVTLLGALVVGFAVFVGPGAVAVGSDLVRGIGDIAGNDAVPWWARLVVGLIVGTVVAVAALAAVAGVSMLVTGVADLVRHRRTVEGRVLRIRERGDENRRRWHIAVDDGSTDRIRAWRMSTRPAAEQGDTVRASVSRWLAHVRGLTVTTPGAAQAPIPSAPTPVGAADAAGPAPALPDAAAVAAAIGRPVHAASDAAAHPLALGGASSAYVTDDGGRLLAAWVPVATLDALRALPRAVAPEVPGVGDHAYRAPAGGGLLVQVGTRALLVAAALPGADAASRDRAVGALASACIATATGRGG